MSGLTDHAKSVADFREKLKALHSPNFPVWEMERLTEFVAFAVAKLSPFQVGERVALAESINPNPDSGWYCHRHMLVAGRQGVIREVDWDGVWRYMWEPENQTWVSSTDGLERPVSRPYHYQMSQHQLMLLPEV